MQDRLSAYIDGILEKAPRTKEVRDLRDELLSGCVDKYNDLTAKGMDQEEAYNTVIGGIGDVDELLGIVSEKSAQGQSELANRSKRAGFVSVGISMFIITVAVVAVASYYASDIIALCSMFVFTAIGVALIVYGNMSTKSVYKKRGDTIVDDVISNRAEDRNKANFKQAVVTTVWSLVVVAYLLISFLTGKWAYTWLIFLLGGIINNVIMIILFKRGRSAFIHTTIWTSAVLIYFIVSFSTNRWDISWIIFPVTIAIQQIFRLASMWKKLGK